MKMMMIMTENDETDEDYDGYGDYDDDYDRGQASKPALIIMMIDGSKWL